MAYSFAGLSSDLAALGKLVSDSPTLQHKIGGAAKTAALEVAAKDLGPDRSFSGFPRKVPLNAGYDTGTPVVLHLRPAGLWSLAQDGRKRSGAILPKKGRRNLARRRGKTTAVMTPRGPRYRSSFRPTKGHKTIDDLMKRLDKDVPDALLEGVNDASRKVFG